MLVYLNAHKNLGHAAERGQDFTGRTLVSVRGLHAIIQRRVQKPLYASSAGPAVSNLDLVLFSGFMYSVF